MGRTVFHRALLVAAGGVIATLLAGAPAGADTVRLAYNSGWAPYSSGAGSSVDGALVRTVTTVLQHMGYAVVNTGLPWARVQRDVRSGHADAMVTFASNERKTYASPSNEVVFSVRTKAFARTGSDAEQTLRTNPEIESLRAFSHCVIIADGWAKSFMQRHDISHANGQDMKGCLRQVAAGRQDIFLNPEPTASAAIDALDLNEKIVMLPTVYREIPLHLLVSKESDLGADFLVAFDAAVGKLRAAGTID